MSSPPATSTTDRSERPRSADAVLAGVAAIPSSTSSTPSRRPTTTERSSGSRSRSSPVGIEPAASTVATAARSACRRGPSKPAGSGSSRSSPPTRATIDPSAEECALLDLRRRGEPDAPPRREGGDCHGTLVLLVRDHHVVRRLPAHDRLLRGPVALERAVELQVVGPEAGDHGDRRAVGREAEMRARQLEDDHAGVGHGQQLGRGPEVPGTSGRARVHLDAGHPEELDEEEGGRRLPGRARDADRRHPRSLEHEVGEAAHAAPGRAEPPDAWRDLGRPDVEERFVVVARIAVEVGVLADVDAERAERQRVGRRRAGARERDRASVRLRAAGRARPRPRRTPRRGSSRSRKEKRPGRRRSPAPADFRGLCTCTERPVNGCRPHGSQRVCGNPRSTLLVDGSGQRDVTTFPRV